MPYGQSTNNIYHPIVDAFNTHPYGSTPYPDRCVNGFYVPHGELQWTRNGSNFNGGPMAKAKLLSPAICRFIQVPYLVYFGPRLLSKHFVPKLNKYVYDRQPMVVWRYKRVKSKVIRSKSGLDLLPNSLNFTEKSCSYYGAREVTCASRYDERYTRRYTGELCSDFVPLSGWGPLTGNLLKHQSSERHDYVEGIVNAVAIKAINKLYERVKDQKVNVGQMIAERRQTIGMLVDAVKRVGNAMLAVKKGNLTKAANLLLPGRTLADKASNAQLLTQFGILPLLSDIDGMAEYLATPQQYERDIIAKSSTKVVDKLVDQWDDGFQKTSVYVTCEVTVKYKCRVRVSSEGFSNLTSLGLGNPMALLHEMTPWSFVTDWFYPLGNYLNNLDAFSGQEVLYTTKTVFSKESIRFVRSFGGSDGDGYIWSPATAGCIIDRVKCQRTLLTEVPQLPPPSLKNPLSKTHIADALALLHQRFSKR